VVVSDELSDEVSTVIDLLQDLEFLSEFLFKKKLFVRNWELKRKA